MCDCTLFQNYLRFENGFAIVTEPSPNQALKMTHCTR